MLLLFVVSERRVVGRAVRQILMIIHLQSLHLLTRPGQILQLMLVQVRLPKALVQRLTGGIIGRFVRPREAQRIFVGIHTQSYQPCGKFTTVIAANPPRYAPLGGQDRIGSPTCNWAIRPGPSSRFPEWTHTPLLSHHSMPQNSVHLPR